MNEVSDYEKEAGAHPVFNRSWPGTVYAAGDSRGSDDRYSSDDNFQDCGNEEKKEDFKEEKEEHEEVNIKEYNEIFHEEEYGKIFVKNHGEELPAKCSGCI